MTILTSSVDPGSDRYRAWFAHNRALATELRERVGKAGRGGPPGTRRRRGL